jgi:hypothetical protein
MCDVYSGVLTENEAFDDPASHSHTDIIKKHRLEKWDVYPTLNIATFEVVPFNKDLTKPVDEWQLRWLCTATPWFDEVRDKDRAMKAFRRWYGKHVIRPMVGRVAQRTIKAKDGELYYVLPGVTRVTIEGKAQVWAHGDANFSAKGKDMQVSASDRCRVTITDGTVEAQDSCTITSYGDATVRVYNRSRATAFGGTVRAHDMCYVRTDGVEVEAYLHGEARANIEMASRVEMRNQSFVRVKSWAGLVDVWAYDYSVAKMSSGKLHLFHNAHAIAHKNVELVVGNKDRVLRYGK